MPRLEVLKPRHYPRHLLSGLKFLGTASSDVEKVRVSVS
jgi:hypothetical protein